MSGLLVRGAADALKRRQTPEPERAPIEDPVKWARERLNVEPWSVQREVMRKVAETGPDAPRRIAVPACHGPGKTALAAWIAAWWLDSRPLGTRFVMSSAPTGDQVKGLLWKEINRAHRRGALPGTITGLKGSGAVSWHIGTELVGWGRKPQDLQDENAARQAFSGVHATEGVLVILDEATGIDPWLWEAALSLMTNASSRIIALGNPDDPESTFAEKCAPGGTWWVRHISAFETPLFTGEPVSDEAAKGLVSPEWVRDAEEDYGGKDNPLYVSKVLGQFPDTTTRGVISPRLVREAWARELPGRETGTFGFDVARSPKGDESALYRIRGGVARRVDSWRGLPITAKPGEDSAVARLELHCSSAPAAPIVIDTDGLGVGAYDGAIAAGLNAARFTAAGPARRPDRYDSRRSELWWEYRKAMESGEVDLDPEDTPLAAQLQAPRWSVNSRGRIHVETKEEMAKRGKKSPDRADAVIMGDAGAPFVLEGLPGPLGEKRAPVRRPDERRDRVRARPGEAAKLRNRPM